MRHRHFGVAVVGAGRMGSLRAGTAGAHPAVTYLAVSDRDRERAEKVGNASKADLISDDNHEIIRDERVDAVIVSTSEPEHAAPAIEAWKGRSAGNHTGELGSMSPPLRAILYSRILPSRLPDQPGLIPK